jgi:hypothetical protein
MRNGLLWALGVWLFGADPLLAQAPPPTGSAARETQAPAGPPPAEGGGDKQGAAAQAPTQASAPAQAPAEYVGPRRYWARPEYLLWWVKSTPLPVPIVTTGDPRVGFDPNNVNTVNTAGAIGQSGTRVLLGDQDIRLGAFSGLRLALGGWVDDEDIFGAEASGFVLERRTDSFAVASDAAGNPPLYFPIFSEIAGAERAIPIADPLRGFSGGVSVNSALRLWGAEGNGIVTLIRNPGLEWTFLAGSRYADLREHLLIDNTTTDLIFNNVTSLNDTFNTHNQFYGSQIGSRLAVQLNRFSLDVTGKVALGVTHQVVDVLGTITQAGPNPLVPPGLGTFTGGLYAQSTNIGRRTANRFSVLPELETRWGYVVNQRTRVFAGYDVLYWSQVVRPGNQVNHNVNLSQNAVLDPSGAGVLVGPAQPAPLFNRSAFWAHGVSFGIEVLF